VDKGNNSTKDISDAVLERELHRLKRRETAIMVNNYKHQRKREETDWFAKLNKGDSND